MNANINVADNYNSWRKSKKSNEFQNTLFSVVEDISKNYKNVVLVSFPHGEFNEIKFTVKTRRATSINEIKQEFDSLGESIILLYDVYTLKLDKNINDEVAKKSICVRYDTISTGDKNGYI